jgi:hypothetical protein
MAGAGAGAGTGTGAEPVAGASISFFIVALAL